MERVAERHVSGSDYKAGAVIEAPLNYIEPTSEKPVYYAYEPPAGTRRQTGQFQAHTVPIRDARAVLGELALDTQGFELTHHETAVKDFYDPEEVRAVYYPEVERLLKEATGAVKVVIFDHQVRNLELAQRGEKNAREYGKIVHNDYTAKSGPRRVRDHLPAAQAGELLKHHFAEINVWRPIRGPIESCRWRCATPAQSIPGTLSPPILCTRTKSGRPIASPTIRITTGTISRGCNVAK